MKDELPLAGSPADPEAPNPAADARFEGLLHEYSRFLRATIARLCPRRAGLDLDDIEQDARMRLWRALRSERKIENLPSYIYRVAATTTIDALRKVTARREESLAGAGDEDETQWSLGAPEPSSPEQEAHRRFLIERVQETLAEMPDESRRALALHLQGYSTEEIGRLLGWTEGKARNLTYRARAELRERLRAEGIAYEGE